jgi:hypothetical protein
VCCRKADSLITGAALVCVAKCMLEATLVYIKLTARPLDLQRDGARVLTNDYPLPWPTHCR